MSARTGQASDKARLLFCLVQDLPLEGFERSFKMSEKKVLWNRFLLGIDKKDIGKERVLEIGKQMEMPEIHLEALMDNLPDANQVLLGFEENEDSCVYKMYLEFWEKITREIRTKPNKTEPVLLHLGFKWDALNPAKCAVTKYLCYPLLSDQGILRRLSYIYDGYEQRRTLEALNEIITLAARKAVDPSFIYLEASEENNPRKSFDVNLYKANLRMKELYPLLSELRRHYSIPMEQFNLRYGQIDTKLFGHMAGGIDREGNDFLTVYYEDSRSAVEHPETMKSQKVGRNEPCPCGSGKKYKKCCGE